MNKPGAYVASSLLFCVVGATIGSVTSYVVTYWGGHSGMLQGVLESQVRSTAAGIFLSNIAFGIGLASAPALVTGVGAASTVHLLGDRLGPLSFSAICSMLGAGLSYLFVGSNQMLGSPVVSGAVAGFLAGLLLWRLFCTWFEVPAT